MKRGSILAKKKQSPTGVRENRRRGKAAHHELSEGWTCFAIFRPGAGQPVFRNISVLLPAAERACWKETAYAITNKAGATNLVKNPLAIELTKTVQVLNNLLRSLGLTPAQRKEFADAGFIPGDGEKDDKPELDEFEKF